MSVYLDIETDRDRNITVLGVYHHTIGVKQLIAPRITRSGLLRILPDARRLVTFNGHCFDLPIILGELNVDLRERYESIDLRYSCQSVGWVGGQKVVERRLRLRRRLPDIDGLYAIYLWRRYQSRCDELALKTLLNYNREDLLQMVKIRSAVRRRLAR